MILSILFSFFAFADSHVYSCEDSLKFFLRSNPNQSFNSRKECGESLGFKSSQEHECFSKRTKKVMTKGFKATTYERLVPPHGGEIVEINDVKYFDTERKCKEDKLRNGPCEAAEFENLCGKDHPFVSESSESSD